MYAIERIKLIKTYLEKHGQAQVQTLSSLLSVSEVTVRRDLERLEAEGWLTRTHGGAVINREETADPFLDLLDEPDMDEKADDIATVASRMIEDDDVIMLMNGPINRVLARLLEKRSNLTVLTNDVTVALAVSLQERNRAVLLGGEMDREEKAAFGSMALSNLRKYHVNKLFIEPDGINENLYLTVNSQNKADLIEGAMEVTGETIAICSVSNFGKSAFFRLGPVKLVAKVISSNTLEDSYKAALFRADIPLYTSAGAFEGTE
ncbi:MAG: DeoR/GlpR transcriptional regulator [Spirochaetales bacterium]|nr:DeoR/GlpR transcriptional regulator [Spirochaetales bacterium]